MVISAMKETSKSEKGDRDGMGRVASKNKVVREGLTEKTFHQRT